MAEIWVTNWHPCLFLYFAMCCLTDLSSWCKNTKNQLNYNTYCEGKLNAAVASECLYYRERWFKEDRVGIKAYEERLIVTFSPEYALYQQQLRAQHIGKALVMIDRKSEKSRQTQQDPRRLIAIEHSTVDGEVAENTVMSLDMELIEKEYVPAYTATRLRARCCVVANVPIDRQIVLARKMRLYLNALKIC